MPCAQVAFVWRHSSTSRFHGRFWPKMGNHNISPGVAILMAKDNKVVRHRIVGIRRLQPIAQLSGFAESGLGEMDMINVGPFASACWRGTLFRGLRCSLRMNGCKR